MKNLLWIASLWLIACADGDSLNITDPPVLPDPGTTSIAAVQGRTTSSPLNGQVVVVEGIVSGDFQDNDDNDLQNLGGFYLQSEFPDADDATSDGVFVFDGNNPTSDVSVGDRVRVTGTVNEYFGETQIAVRSIRKTGKGSLQAIEVNLPGARTTSNSDGDAIVDLERFEGMLVKFPQELTISNLRFLERFGEIGLAQGGRPEQFTNANSPSQTDYAAHKKNIAARSVVLDDGQRNSFPSSYRFLEAGSEAGYTVRAGDTITGLIGNLRYSRGSGSAGVETWRLMPAGEPQFVASNPRPTAPKIGGTFRVANFNVLNYFTSIDSGRPVCGPRNSDNCRGADSKEELKRQTDKIVTAIVLMDADIIGLVEVENAASKAVAALRDAINDRLGSAIYNYIDTGTIHDDAIKTALLYRTATTQAVGDFAVLDSSVDARFDDGRNRPALAQTFRSVATGGTLTVAVNHLKSKGSACTANGDPNRNDGQGNCNRTRTDAAKALVDWLDGDPTRSGDPDYLIIGDLNAYTREDPIAALESQGLSKLLGDRSQSYSFLFDAQIGALDHAFVSASLLPQVKGAEEWHINADEPPLLDYNLENDRDPELFDADTPFRASDHDPIIVGLDLLR